MAKKKKRTSKKSKASSKKKKVEKQLPKEPNMFLRQVGSVSLILAAVLLAMGGIGTGGSLPVGMFDIAYSMFGVAAYLTPVALAYWGIHKFRASLNKLK